MRVTKQQASLNQVLAAISLYGHGRFDCAITLAAAAEGILPNVDDPHIFQQLQAKPNARDLELNLMVNWLKHGRGAEGREVDAAELSDFEAAIIIARAITKYAAVYHQGHPGFVEFWNGAHAAGHLPALTPR